MLGQLMENKNITKIFFCLLSKNCYFCDSIAASDYHQGIERQFSIV